MIDMVEGIIGALVLVGLVFAFANLFGIGRRSRRPLPVVEEVEADPLPSVILRSGLSPQVGKLGGHPDLPARHDWPQCDGAPLTFLAQLDLSALHGLGAPDWLPDHGALFFFYGVDQSQGELDQGDRNHWSVIYDQAGFADAPRVLPEGDAYDESPVGGRFYNSLPDAETVDGEPAGSEPWHQVGGYPYLIQGDTMPLECQLASNGIALRTRKDYETPRALELAEGAREWRLLLQLDCDESTGMEWGDTGMLYFWVREAEARRGAFTGVWTVMECY